jgi:MFS family permease
VVRRSAGLALLRRNRDFRTLFTAQVISYCGDWFATVALLGLVLEITGSSVAAALVWVAQSLPAFLVTPLAGPCADRFDRRRIMVIASAIQTIAALAFLLVGSNTVWLAFLAQGAITALSAFFAPASQAAVPNLVGDEDLALATSMLAATWGAMLAIGAALGAGFTALFGRDAAFVADALSFVVAGGLIATITTPTKADRGTHHDRMKPIADTVAALRHAHQDRPLLYTLFAKGGYGLASGVVGLLAVLSVDRFASGDGGTGLLLAARGAGALMGPLIAARVAGVSISRILRACGIASLVFGVAYALVGLSTWLIVAALLVFVAHFGSGSLWTLSTVGLQVRTPDDLRGRILAADFAIVTLTSSVSVLAAGELARYVGLTPAFVALGAVSVVWGLVYLRLTQTVRQCEAVTLRSAPDVPARSSVRNQGPIEETGT